MSDNIINIAVVLDSFQIEVVNGISPWKWLRFIYLVSCQAWLFSFIVVKEIPLLTSKKHTTIAGWLRKIFDCHCFFSYFQKKVFVSNCSKQTKCDEVSFMLKTLNLTRKTWKHYRKIGKHFLCDNEINSNLSTNQLVKNDRDTGRETWLIVKEPMRGIQWQSRRLSKYDITILTCFSSSS